MNPVGLPITQSSSLILVFLQSSTGGCHWLGQCRVVAVQVENTGRAIGTHTGGATGTPLRHSVFDAAPVAVSSLLSAGSSHVTCVQLKSGHLGVLVGQAAFAHGLLGFKHAPKIVWQ